MTSSLREIRARGETALGTACMIPSGFSAELLAHLGFDFLMIDCQHGLIGYDAMVNMLQAVSGTGASAIVRVQSNTPSLIGSALDAGAEGVVVPLVGSRADAERAAAATRYPPQGERSSGPVRSELYFKGSFAEVNEQVLCIALIETVAGVEAAEEICSCPGIDGVMLGPGDLALSMGLPARAASDELEDAMNTVLKAALAHDRIAMIGSGGADHSQRRAEQGYGMLLLGADYMYLRAAAGGALEGVRRAVSQTTADAPAEDGRP